MAKPKPPVVIAPGAFQPPDTRASFVQGTLWIVRPSKNDRPCVVDIGALRCYIHGDGECSHVNLARKEHQRLFAIYGDDIPDSETVLLDAVMRGYYAIAPEPQQEEGVA